MTTSVRRFAAALGLAVAAVAASATLAHAQVSAPALVTHVVDGDTLDLRAADGREVRVRLIGIDAPQVQAGVECEGPEARKHLVDLVEGRTVTLVTDPTQTLFDDQGQLYAYVDRDDGLDAGREMLQAGWAEVNVVDGDFQRLGIYRQAQREARESSSGVWENCEGDFHRSRTEVLRETRRSAVAFLRRYYRRVSNKQFRTAWGMLGRRVRRDIGRFGAWKAGHRRSLGVSVLSAQARLTGQRAVLRVSLRARDRDACSGRVVRTSFRGRWTLSPRRKSWVAMRVRIRKTGGGGVRLDKSECRAKPTPSPRPPAPPTDCQGYSPCIPPGPDVDCAGGSGDGPRYRSGPIYVNGADPYDLDGDGDGVACES